MQNVEVDPFGFGFGDSGKNGNGKADKDFLNGTLMATGCTLSPSPKDKGQHSVTPWVQEKWEWKMVGWMDIQPTIRLSGEFLLKK